MSTHIKVTQLSTVVLPDLHGHISVCVRGSLYVLGSGQDTLPITVGLLMGVEKYELNVKGADGTPLFCRPAAVERAPQTYIAKTKAAAVVGILECCTEHSTSQPQRAQGLPKLERKRRQQQYYACSSVL